MSVAIKDFAPALLAWFDVAGRKDLPWQRERSAYRVWVSEIMLQQTQVATVIPYFERFMQHYPDVQALAGASLDEVLHLWTGLGYYARARNLHRAAQQVVSEHGGEFPATPAVMQSLPGIGRSTAAAILAQARNQRHAILDGNVKRVLARYFAVDGFPGEKKIETQLWGLAEVCMPATRAADYTQAIMDLGALICTRAKPHCGRCPLQAHCQAYARDLQTVLPVRKPKKIRPQRIVYVAVVVNGEGALWLEQRPAAGLWGGLWICPQFEAEGALRDWLQSRWPDAEDGEWMPVIEHAFTHFDLTLHPLRFTVSHGDRVAESTGHCWYDPVHPARIGLAKPAVDIIGQVARERT